MRTLKSRLLAGRIVLLLAAMVSISFIAPRGGDVFKIYINNKMVVEQFVHDNPKMKVITLDQRNDKDEVSVYYSHCGQIGKSRQLSIRDASNRIIKTWKFADAEEVHTPMTFQVKEILDAYKGKMPSQFTILYTSKELPRGYALANVVTRKGDQTLAGK